MMPAKLVPELKARLTNLAAFTRATVVITVKYSINECPEKIDDIIYPVISSFLMLVNDQDQVRILFPKLFSCHFATLMNFMFRIHCSGANYCPGFRILIAVERITVVVQGFKFDPEGEYVRQWLPELARMPSSIKKQTNLQHDFLFGSTILFTIF